MAHAGSQVALLGAVAAFLLAGCAQDPFDANAQWRPTQDDPGTTRVTEPLGAPAWSREGRARTVEAGPAARDARNPIVEVCYGDVINATSAVVNAARELCPDGTKRMKRLGTDSFWNDCPLFQPERAAYRCVTDPEKRS